MPSNAIRCDSNKEHEIGWSCSKRGTDVYKIAVGNYVEGSDLFEA